MPIIQLIFPLQVLLGFGRASSPITGAIVAISGLAGVSPFQVAKRTFIPMLFGTAITMTFTNRMPSRCQGNRFLVVHRHARESNTDIVGCFERVRLAINAFRINIDQPHHHRRQRIFQITFPRVTGTFAAGRRKPLFFGAPINVFFRMPDILATKGETIGF